MSDLSFTDLARVTVDDFRRAHDLPPGAAAALIAAVEIALLTAVRHERAACASLCAGRQLLWERTADQTETAEPLRAEAEDRAKEAAYLADAIAARR